MNKDEASFGIPSEPCLGEAWGERMYFCHYFPPKSQFSGFLFNSALVFKP